MTVTGLPASLDGLKLRAEVAAALSNGGWASAPARMRVIGLLKAARETGRQQAFAKLDGVAGGLEAARFLADITNSILVALFAALEVENSEAANEIALCAVGGFGAGELAPGSDIDILFLKSDTAGDDTNAFIEQAVMALWDMGLKVGSAAVRTIDETLELSSGDVSERTSLLSARFLAGNRTLADELDAQFREQAEASSGAEFVDAKLKERDRRIARAGRSRYTVEPNIKDSKGGLRDLQLLRWLAQFLYGADAFERWVASGLLTVADVEKYLKASDFLWTTRFHLHDLTGGKDDRLTFDLQPEIAARLGFDDGATEIAVERFMRRYFLTAMDVGSLTRLVSAKLEADAWKTTPRGLGRFLPGNALDDDEGDAAFSVREGRVDFADPRQIAKQPYLLMRLFQAAAEREADLHPNAIATVGRSLRLVDDDFRDDPLVKRTFFTILLESSEPHIILRLMTEAGLLGLYLPEFGAIVARTQFNMYHRYTVDEHTLHALGLMREIEQGRHPADHPLASKIIGDIKYRRALHLAILLHDTGKGQGDQCIEGAARAREACERLGLPDEETELVAWLVKSHLIMSDTAQRRDLGDPKTVINFARTVGTLERMRLLLLLTIVDIRAVGEGVWNGWKGQLLRDLYSATEAVLADGAALGGTDSEVEARSRLSEKAAMAREQIRTRLSRIDPDFANDWADGLDDAYWLAFRSEDRFRHAAFARSARALSRRSAVAVRIDRRRVAAEVMILSPDRDGLFADIASALSDLGANVIGAQVTTTQSGQAFNVFFVQDANGRPYGIGRARARDALLERVRRAAAGEKLRPVVKRDHLLRRRSAAFDVRPSVSFDDTIAQNATVIEASGRDRPGLLADLAHALAASDVSLLAAQIDGYGERAVDVFNVVKDGKKLKKGRHRDKLRDRLLEVLGEEEEAWAEQARNRGLARAELSVGR